MPPANQGRRRGPATAQQPASRQPSRSTGGAGKSWMKTGQSIATTAEQDAAEMEERRQRRMAAGGNVFDFYLTAEAGKNEAEIIILDDNIESAVAFYEHNLKLGNPPKFGHYEACCKDFDVCPLCEAYGDSYYCLMLTVLDLRGYESQTRGRVEQSRKLLRVKSRHITQFRELQEANGGSLRGMYLVMRRDVTDKQSSRIGEPVVLQGGKLFDVVPEEEMAGYANPEIKGRDGTVIVPAGADIEPYDYAELFKAPDPDDMRTRYHLGEADGSRRQQQRELVDGGGAEEPAAEETSQPGTRRRAPAAGAAPAQSPRRQPAAQPQDGGAAGGRRRRPFD